MGSMFLLIPLSLMLFVIAIWAIRYAVKSNQFEDLDNASQRIILEDRQERRQVLQEFGLSDSGNKANSQSNANSQPDVNAQSKNDINPIDKL